MKNRLLLFWSGSLIATIGSYIALSASLMNLYRIGSSSRPVLLMMFIEALIPVLTVRILPRLMNSINIKLLFIVAAAAGTIGASTQAFKVSDLFFQIIGIIFTSIAASIQKPLMLQFAAKISDDPEFRKTINNVITLINYSGVLFGYLLSGVVIEYYGYSACFSINAFCFIIFAVLVRITRFETNESNGLIIDTELKTAEAATPNNANLNSLKNHTVFNLVLLLTGLMWLTGGSVNVLEVEFAKIILKVSELQISILFFVSAIGAITFSLVTKQYGIGASLRRLQFATIISAFAILSYALVAHYFYVLPFLFLYGFSTAYHGFCAMTLVQDYSPPEDLSRNSVLLNTVTQSVTLGAAALGILVSTFTASQTAIFIFSALTIIGALFSNPIFWKSSNTPSIDTIGVIEKF